MKLYLVQPKPDSSERNAWFGTRSEAQGYAGVWACTNYGSGGGSPIITKSVRDECRITEREVTTSKKGVLLMLNKDDCFINETTVLRTWKLSPRGGLVECDDKGRPLKGALDAGEGE